MECEPMDLYKARGKRPARTFLCSAAIAVVVHGVLTSCARQGDVSHASAPEVSPQTPTGDAKASPVQSGAGAPSEVCIAVMHRTRDCENLYVPALLALRVRLDQPPGIAARFKEEGKDAMLEAAHSQFSQNWSDEAIAQNCKALSDKAMDEQERIITPERRCLETTDCSAFTRCDLAHKEERWTTNP